MSLQQGLFLPLSSRHVGASKGRYISTNVLRKLHSIDLRAVRSSEVTPSGATSPITRPLPPSHLADVAESVDVWHRGGLVSAHHYFPRLMVEPHAELVQAQGFGFRGSAWETGQGEDCVTAQERLSM